MAKFTALFALGLLTACFFIGRAHAQTPTPKNESLPTMFKPMKSSLQQLLDHGWKPVSFGPGFGGYGYLLRRHHKWVTCVISTNPKDTTKFVSQCMAMN